MCLLRILAGVLVATCTTLNASASNHNVMSIERAIAVAVQNDPWLTASTYREASVRDNSTAAGVLPEPTMSFSIANLPTDGFTFNQEPMTQLKFGVSQVFPKGNSLAIRRQQLQESAQQHPYLREDRKAQVRVTVASLWLDVYRAQRSIALIKQDRQLFAQLAEVAQVNYASALGNVRQHDIVRAQLELSRLEDRLSELRIQEQKATALLMEWIVPAERQWTDTLMVELNLAGPLPQIPDMTASIERAMKQNAPQEIVENLLSHPRILATQQRISASQSGVALAKQDKQPLWGVNASYAYRADDPAGASRADFLSVGLTLQVPLFSSVKQDSQISAAINEREAIKTDKLIMLRSMLYNLKSVYVEHEGLKERQHRYQSEILKQMREQAEASLTAYTNDDGDFAEVVRARIADLNARIDALDIDVDLLKARVQIAYFLTQSPLKHAKTWEQ